MTEEAEVCSKISEKVKMAGFLEKKGSMLWKRYWFVLEDKLLLYYKSQLEYINLSPCRGSLNMNLVSGVQPRRNSREAIIHLVSRSQNLVLKAKDRETQEKWLQALVDSIGKQGMSTLRFSLDDLPGETQKMSQTMTLPRRLHGGSLDTVWKSPVIPKTKMLDKVLGYEDEADENQNTDLYDPLNVERKSQTLDRRRMDTKLQKIRNAIGRRKSSTSLMTPEPEKALKIRRESFITKMFKRTIPSIEKDVEITDSDGDDPLYDKIDHSKCSEQQKPIFGSKILLPEGTMTELKEKLRSKESLEKLALEGKEPPALPPRVSLTNADSTTEVIVHHETGKDLDDSEESEISGHYQVIRKPGKEVPQIEVAEVKYQVVNKDKKKKKPEITQKEELGEGIQIEPGAKFSNEGIQEVIVNVVTGLKIQRTEHKEELEPSGDHETEKTNKQQETNETITIFGDENKQTVRQDMENGLCELNILLLRLAEINEAPLANRSGLSSWSPDAEQRPHLKRSQSDPDYDIPRPHAPLAVAENFDEDRIQATEFFNKAEESSTGSTNSLEPDSLEAKKDICETKGE